MKRRHTARAPLGGFSIAALSGAPDRRAGGLIECPGCLEHPSPDCAACGRPAVAFVAASAACAMSLCAACLDVMRACREGAAYERERAREHGPAGPRPGRPRKIAAGVQIAAAVPSIPAIVPQPASTPARKRGAA